MLSWSIFFLIIALAAVLLRFSTISETAAGSAKNLFGVFLVPFVISLSFVRRIARDQSMFEWRGWFPRARPCLKTRVPLEPLKGLSYSIRQDPRFAQAAERRFLEHVSIPTY